MTLAFIFCLFLEWFENLFAVAARIYSEVDARRHEVSALRIHPELVAVSMISMIAPF